MTVKDIESQIFSGKNISHEQTVYISDNWATEKICELADKVRAHFMGSKIDTCSIMNARSGRCSEDCKWCSQSVHHKSKIDIYPLVGKDDAVANALDNHSKGVGRFSLVTSGRAMTDREVDKACDIYNAIAQKCSIYLCASMGLLSKNQLQRLKDCGVGHYHCNIETAPSYFSKLCTTHTFEDKLRTIDWAKEVGLKICSGGIIGMGETMAQRVEMAFVLREIGVVSIPINILNPIEGTALEAAEALSDDEVLRTFGLFRLVNPQAHIRFAGGRTRISHIQARALRSGVSAALVGDLLTTIGFNIEQDKKLFSDCGFEY
ncbi:Biotin synthase [Mucinivorans hirudinis]|uniref:Biotin synthase n=1 Tax=Mucinivorans hirudinis TaxID=1433126 RepID=A0A060RA12_9BACT|nr:Biotin synthase [Mucinivorans hirudinis]